MSIAHIAVFSRRHIERRELPLGTPAPPEAVVIVGKTKNPSKPAKFQPAGGAFAPPGWPERLSRALRRAAEALGFQLVDRDEEAKAVRRLHDESLSKEKFVKLARSYISDAEAAVLGLQDELELRRREVADAARRFGLKGDMFDG